MPHLVISIYGKKFAVMLTSRLESCGRGYRRRKCLAELVRSEHKIIPGHGKRKVTVTMDQRMDKVSDSP